MIRPIKRLLCWVIGHKHQAAGHYSMCWRCGQIKAAPKPGGHMSLYTKLANAHPALQRGQVWCRQCGKSQRVNSAEALRSGWPKCCGYTMTIDAPKPEDGQA